jgi:hypothetical protein
MLRVLGAVILLAAFSSQAKASGFQIDPGFMYLTWSETSSGTTTSQSKMPLHLGVNYRFDGPIVVGALLATESNQLSNGSSTVKDSFLSYGPTFGLETDNVYLFFSYMISSEFSRESGGSTIKYTNGNGFYVALGYRFDAGSLLSFGPQLVYANLKYTKATVGSSSDITVDLTESWVLPMVALSFKL